VHNQDLLKMNDLDFPQDLLHVYHQDLMKKINDLDFPQDLLCVCMIKIY
jgi:hypothetical protein